MATIDGIVTIGLSETPGEATVVLLNDAGTSVIATTVSDSVTGAYSFTGLADETAYRIVVMGGSEYRSRAYGPCMTPDASYSSVSSLLYLNGNDGDTAITDEKGKVWTPYGNAQIDTAQSKFGGASLLLDGTGDYITTPDHADWDFGSGSFTVEGWVRPASFAAVMALFNKRATLGLYSPFGLYLNTTTGAPGMLCSLNGTSWGVNILSSIGLSLDTWAHIAFVRNGTTFSVYVNGASGASATVSGALMTNATAVSFGATTTAGDLPFNGHLDCWRVTKGVARYTGAFTPRTRPFANY